MKRKFLTALFVLSAICSAAQIQSPGRPAGFERSESAAAASLRSASAGASFIDLGIDTTAAFPVGEGRVFCTGHVSECDIASDNAGESFTASDGSKIWRVGLSSPGAEAIALVLKDFELPEGAYLYVYNPEKTMYYGGFGAANNNAARRLTIRPFPSDSIILEYVEPEGAAFAGSFRVCLASHETIAPSAAMRRAADFYEAEACSPHAALNPDLEDYRRAVCMQYVVKPPLSQWSTGTLINNAGGRPLVYTASHALYSSAGESADVIFSFNYEVPALDTLMRGSGDCTVSGATVLSRYAKTDAALLEMSVAPPVEYRPYMLGWSAESLTGPFVCIQHPNGDIKRYSTVSSVTEKSWAEGYQENGFWMVRAWEKGTTASGSSGAPLIDMASGMVVGCLTGGNSTCSSPIYDYFNRFDVAFDYYSDSDKQLKCHLDPSDTGIRSMEGREYYWAPCTRESAMDGSAPVLGKLSSGGYLAGHNALGHAAYAQKFSFDEEQLVHGAYVVQHSSGYSNSNVNYLCVYAGGDVPGELLARAELPKYSSDGKFLISGGESFASFSGGVEAGTEFYVAVELEYGSAIDSLGIYSASGSGAYFGSGGQWTSFASHPEAAGSRSLWIDPVVRSAASLGVEENSAENVEVISVYPNPSSGRFAIEGFGDDLSYRVYDLSGRLCAEGEGREAVLGLQSGTYLLTAADGERTASCKLLIK